MTRRNILIVMVGHMDLTVLDAAQRFPRGE